MCSLVLVFLGASVIRIGIIVCWLSLVAGCRGCVLRCCAWRCVLRVVHARGAQGLLALGITCEQVRITELVEQL